MATLHKERRVRARRAFDTQRALYRNELQRARQDREVGLADAENAMARMAHLLPGAVQCGLSIVELAQLTGISRPTIYRMLADARKQQDLRGLARQFEEALACLTGELGRQPLPADLAPYLNLSDEELEAALGQVFTYLAHELESFGSSGLTVLVDLLPGLGTPEKIILNMLLLQRLPTDQVARSTKLTPARVLAWAGLGLLRLMPDLR